MLRNDDALSLAAILLFSSSCYEAHENEKFEQFCLQYKSYHPFNTNMMALKLIRENLHMQETDMLLIVVDEFGQDWGHPHAKTGMHEQFMRLMGNCRVYNVAVIFSSLTESKIFDWRWTNRVLNTIELTRLDQRTVNHALETNLKGFEHKKNAIKLIRNPRIQGIIRQCFGHPRCVNWSSDYRACVTHIVSSVIRLNPCAPPALFSMLLSQR